MSRDRAGRGIPILLTSFQTWLPHQRSNASDDLLQLLVDRAALPAPCILLRKLPVDFEVAPARVRAAVRDHQPAAVICLGMAEGRSRLALEQFGRCGRHAIATSFDLDAIAHGTGATETSDDAGTYVCNDLYYKLLCDHRRGGPPVLFIHVPVLTEPNTPAITADGSRLIAHLWETIRPDMATDHSNV